MKSIQSKNSTPANCNHSPFFKKESGNSLFVKNEKPFFNASPIRAKLTVNQPNDPYEKEADAVADKVIQRLNNKSFPNTENNQAPFFRKSSEPIQRQCAACGKEEKLQKKEQDDENDLQKSDLQRKPVFESDGEPPEDENIRRKCAACEKEDKLQKKPESSRQTASPDIEKSLNSSKGSGSPLPHNTREEMGTSFGADFSGVRIHNDTSSQQMNKDLNAQAFTHGSDIYFNSGKYDTSSTAGKHLLAHELTHVVQQNGNNMGNNAAMISTNPDVNIQKVDFSDIKYTMPIYWMYRANTGIFSALSISANTYFDIKGKTEYKPDYFTMMYILNYFDEHNTNRVPVKVKYGGMGSGTIIIEKGSNDKFSTTGKFLIGIDHPAFQVDPAKNAVALEVEITDNVISGSIGIPRGRTGDSIKDSGDSPLISYGGFHVEDLYPVIFGEAYDGQNFTLFQYVNQLSAFGIDLQLSGWLNVNHSHNIESILVIVDDVYKWSGNLKTHITGTAEYDLPVERTPSGLLSAESEGIQLDSQWQGQGFILKAGLRIVYSKKTIELYGNAEYKSKRAEGSVNIAVVPEPKAQTLFRQYVPAKYREELLTGRQVKDDEYLDAPLALTAWGDFKFTLLDKAKKLTGSAALAVSPEGYIVTAGQVKFQKDFILMDELNKEYVLFEDEMNFPLTLFGVPLDFSLRGDIKTGYKIGPVAMYEITASGVYSNHPDYASELCIGAKFEMPANLYGALNLVAAAAIRVGYKWASVTLVEIGGKLNARADLNAFVNAMPSIGVRDGGAGEPEYCILGKLYAGGELVLSLDAGMEISLFRKIKTDDGGEEKKSLGKKDGFGQWSIGDFGFELSVDYTLGSDEKPEFRYTGGKFNKAAFQRAFKRNSGEVKPTELKGGFIQDGKQTGVVDDESIKSKEVDQGSQPLGPFELVTEFEMNGTPHKLFLVVSGTEGTPQAKIDMSSEREDLIIRTQEEIEQLEEIKNSTWLIGTGGLSEDQEKKIDLEIKRLKRIIAKTENVQASVKTTVADPETPADISAPGFEPLAEEIEDLGEQFNVNDLGDGTPPAVPVVAVPDVETDQPPEGVEVILKLPPQKSVYLDLYKRMVAQGSLQHRVEREKRDTNQQDEWDSNLTASMPRGTFCLGRGLGLTQDDILRPYWSRNFLDASRKTRKKPRKTKKPKQRRSRAKPKISHPCR